MCSIPAANFGPLTISLRGVSGTQWTGLFSKAIQQHSTRPGPPLSGANQDFGQTDQATKPNLAMPPNQTLPCHHAGPGLQRQVVVKRSQIQELLGSLNYLVKLICYPQLTTTRGREFNKRRFLCIFPNIGSELKAKTGQLQFTRNKQR